MDDKKKDEKQKMDQPQSIQFKAYYVQKRRKKRKSQEEEV